MARQPSTEHSASPSPVTAAQALGPMIQGCADQIERERQLPPSLVAAMTDAGLCKLSVPPALGGGQADPVTLVRVIEEIARADGSAAWCLMTAIQFGMAAADLPLTGGQMIFADPHAFVAGVIVPVGRARKVDGGYRVTGRWRYASGCLHATWLAGACVVYEGDMPRSGTDGKPENRWVFVPVADCQIIDT
jgi:indole-3-acetate monooxygenase